MAHTLLLTGRPGVGKTTIIKVVAKALGGRAGGFYTEEIRLEGRREGFRLVTLEGQEAIMAHVRLSEGGRPCVGRYGVDVASIERIGVDSLRRAEEAGKIVIVDEIGKMELFSESFRTVMLDIVDGTQPVIATAMMKTNPWVDRLKGSSQVETWEITTSNRDEVPERVLRWLDR